MKEKSTQEVDENDEEALEEGLEKVLQESARRHRYFPGSTSLLFVLAVLTRRANGPSDN